jgi:hypothetical protein
LKIYDGGKLNIIPINPGLNTFTDQQVKVAEKCPLWKELLDNDVHRIKQFPTEDSKKKDDVTDDISKMNQKDAIKVVEGTLSIPALEKMLDMEAEGKNRVKVRAAIEDQIEEMNKLPIDEGKKDKDD